MTARVAIEDENRQPATSNGGRIGDWSARSVDLLAHLRLMALRCRASARADLGEACARLHAANETVATAHAEMLVRTLPQALGRVPRFHRPGVEEISFDEAWLLRAFEAVVAGDTDSLDFLLRSRVAPAARRDLFFLIANATRLAAAA